MIQTLSPELWGQHIQLMVARACGWDSFLSKPECRSISEAGKAVTLCSTPGLTDPGPRVPQPPETAPTARYQVVKQMHPGTFSHPNPKTLFSKERMTQACQPAETNVADSSAFRATLKNYELISGPTDEEERVGTRASNSNRGLHCYSCY